MSMEHRWSERKPIEMDVALYYAPVGTITGTTRDVSLEGMYVQTNGIDLPLHAELEVSFVTRTGSGAPHEHHLPAYVVHGNGAGVGLMLRHIDYSDFYALRHMLSAA
ncbi:MAG TPA: PilZ domain-containing protein [Gammaproteobacteria bacterium]